MTQSQIYVLAFSNIDQATHQYNLVFLLSPDQRSILHLADYSIRNILIGFH